MSESKHTIYESRASTHADDCWSWGPGHYKCAVREIERLRTENERLREDACDPDTIRELLAFDTMKVEIEEEIREGGCETCDYGSRYGFTVRVSPGDPYQKLV